MPRIQVKGNADAFKDIYRTNGWEDPNFNSGGGSGGGSDPKYCKKFIKWILDYIKQNDIKSVLDLGCGDFRIASHYYEQVERFWCVDTVCRIPKSVQPRFRELDFSVPTVVEDIFKWSGSVNLVIIKDVLMHWTDNEITRFLQIFAEMPWNRCVITNRWRYARKPELNGTKRNPTANKYRSSPLPHDHKSLRLLPFTPVLYYPSKNSIQVCECVNPKMSTTTRNK